MLQEIGQKIFRKELMVFDDNKFLKELHLSKKNSFIKKNKIYKHRDFRKNKKKFNKKLKKINLPKYIDLMTIILLNLVPKPMLLIIIQWML